jgi:hypothetical protein
MAVRRLMSVVVGLGMLSLPAVAPAVAVAASPPAAPPKIESAEANDELSVIFIHGQGFGSGAPSITLDGAPLQMLTNDGTTVAAKLIPGTPRGKYRLVLARADGKQDKLDFVLAPAGEAPAVPPAKKPDRPSGPVIEDAVANDELSVIFIHGTGFGEGAPAVALDGKPLQMLTNDGTTIAAKLKPGTGAGSYPLVVTRADGRSAAFAATLGPAQR